MAQLPEVKLELRHRDKRYEVRKEVSIPWMRDLHVVRVNVVTVQCDQLSTCGPISVSSRRPLQTSDHHLWRLVFLSTESRAMLPVHVYLIDILYSG